jgi:hypothetical protein
VYSIHDNNNNNNRRKIMFAKKDKIDLKDDGEIVEITKHKPFGRFRRRSQQPAEPTPSVPDERTVATADRSQEGAREAAASVADERSIFGGKDKRQKKIVYKTFSENPIQVLEAVVEEIPEPASDRHVIIKVSVSSLDCFIRR